MLRILYRGGIKDCNYQCTYCSLPKSASTRREYREEEASLERFIHWVQTAGYDPLEIMFTPFGEVLIHPFYRKAIQFLSKLHNVNKVVIQTNLSCELTWLEGCHRNKIALWCTYHPGHADLDQFIEKCLMLKKQTVRFSVGAVAIEKNIRSIQTLRDKLPRTVYLWLNAHKGEAHAYTDDIRRIFEQMDPLFKYNTRYYPSEHKLCRCGESQLSVYGNGDIKRCHFTSQVLGNLYDTGIKPLLKSRPCPEKRCHCHIGYIHLVDMPFYDIFKHGVLERIPYGWPNAFITSR